MLIQAPLPTWSQLVRALGRRPPCDAELAATWCHEGDIGGWLSRSTWSLALVALWRKDRVPASHLTVWVPDFFCNTSLAAIRRVGARLVFYPLTDSMAPDMAVCRTMASTDPPDLFLLVHYFGRPAAAAAARDLCHRHGAWLIEDAAHVLRPINGIGVHGDFVIYSPHKHLPIPDGAVLVARASGAARLGADALSSFGSPSSWPLQLRALQWELGCSERSGRIHAIAWLFKRLLQKFGVRSPKQKPMPFAEVLSAGPAVSGLLVAPPVTGLARRLLGAVLPDMAVVVRKRQRHQMLWDAVLLKDDDRGHSHVDEVSADDRPAHREWTPYLTAYRTNPAQAEATYKRWQCNGLPVVTWPDLPPEVTARKECHPHAWGLRHNRLYLPVHQSLSTAQILSHFRVRGRTGGPVPSVSLVWDGVTRGQWQQWIERATRASLVQTWPYGDAKSEHSGWVVKRGLLYRTDEPIAMVQMLHRRVGGLLSVARINRGPVPLRALSPEEQRALWEQLSKLGSWWRGRVLCVAPELNISGSSLMLMNRMGFRQFSPRSWESAWIDLRLELDVLRMRLDRKWRNMLTSSEKTGLSLEAGSDDRLFEWMIAQYRALMVDKHFEGPSIDLLVRLRKQVGSGSPLLILRALHDGEAVAGICVARHGTAATYLLGWNGDTGRNLKANQYLLWQAIECLKRAGVRWFDLGGISEEQTPGIAMFKLGLNGHRYELVGEYWKW